MINTEEILSEINIHNKYGMYLADKQRRETWPEICNRYHNMLTVMLAKKGKEVELRESLSEAMKLVAEKKILPSMRGLQFAGEPIFRNPVRLYNCSFLVVNCVEAFSETMFLLLSGTGVGFSVQKHHVAQLPIRNKERIERGSLIRECKYIIKDSVEGWSDAILFLIRGYLGGNYVPIFDYTLIRSKGSAIRGISGKAPGPEPLRKCLTNIEKLLLGVKRGTRLRPIDVHDIMCHIADAVLEGGIRRSATISLFSIDDTEMLECKAGNWWVDNPQRARANNSVILERSNVTFSEFWKVWKKVERSNSGEPGIVFTNDKEFGMNPCAEIALEDMGFCNLVEINSSDVVDDLDFDLRVRSATLLATLQSLFTDFTYLRPAWKVNAETDRLIGVSLTGIADGEALKYDLSAKATLVDLENARIASILDIPKSKRQTTVKPSGNSSVVLKTSAGVHARHSKYYWRRIRINITDPMWGYLSTTFPQLVEVDHFDPNVFIVKVAVKSPKNSILRKENPLALLSRIKKIYKSWIVGGHKDGSNTNNISATVSIKKHQWVLVGLWLWFNKNYYTGMSVLPYDGGSYPQTPYEDCTEHDYNKFVKSMGGSHNLYLDNCLETSDGTNFSGEVACGAGGCDI